MQIIEYFTYLTGLVPTESQKRLLEGAIDLTQKKILITAGRQSGKTLTSAVIVMWYVFEYPEPLKILLISAQDNILYFHIREVFKKHPELVNELTERSKLAAELVPIHGFETVKGSVVFVKGSTEKQIKGIPADIVVIDEACMIKNERLLEAIGNITGEISKFVTLSTPDNDASLFVKWAIDKKSGFKVYTWEATIDNCPWHNKDIESTKKKEYSKQMYATQVLGRPPTKQERSFFSRKDIDACVQSVETIREGGVTSRIEIGIDFGREDETVLIITERVGTTRRKILDIKRFDKKDRPPDICGPIILDIIRKWNPHISKGDSKPEEYNEWFRKHGNKVRMVDFSIHKEQMMGQLQKTIREHRLLISTEFMYLKIALEQYRLRRGEEYFRGKGAKTSGSDLVEALALSCYESETLTPSKGSIVVFPRRNGRYGNYAVHTL